MKSFANGIETKSVPYPKMMKHKDNGMIVLFKTVFEGVVIHKGTQKDWEIGWIQTQWPMSKFEDFHGNVVIHSE